MAPATSVSIFVIHSKKLGGRNIIIDKITNAIKKGDTNSDIIVDKLEIIDKWDSEELTENDINRFVSIGGQDIIPPFDKFVTPIHINQLSNALKHTEALKRSSESGSSVNLVLEDDVLFNEDTLHRDLAKTIKHAPRAWGMLFLGLPFSPSTELDEGVDYPSQPPLYTRPRYQPTEKIFKAVIPSCESYVITSTDAKNMFESMLPIRFQTHVHLSWILWRQILQGPAAFRNSVQSPRSFIVTPNIFIDGSKLGAFTSTLNINNRLSWNPAYVKLAQLIRNQPNKQRSLCFRDMRNYPKHTGNDDPNDQEQQNTAICR